MRLGFAPFRGSNPRASAGHGPLPNSGEGASAVRRAKELQLASSLAPQRLAHPLGRSHPRMAEHLLGDAGMHALLDQQSLGRVAGIVNPGIADLRLSEDRLPDPPILGALDRPAAPSGEYGWARWRRVRIPQLGGKR